MVPKVRRRIQTKLSAYRRWLARQALRNRTKARAVQYCGWELVSAFDLLLAEVEQEIEGLIAEGFRVDWAENDGWVYLRIWEGPGPEPDWDAVFAESDVGEPCDPPAGDE